MKALIDCNSFYCSCEKVFRPDLDERPIVVLSNNDGCIISRTDEAKAIGIGMAGPYFKAKPLIEAHNVEVFSSNYNLYGDMSWRVMEVLKTIVGEKAVEVYSVDEAFLDPQGYTGPQLKALAREMRDTVDRWTGIKVSIGIAPTKTLAKLANRTAKKNKALSECITILDREEEIIASLKNTGVRDIWGIGRRYADKLNMWGITTAWEVRNLPEEWVRKNMRGVVGLRLWRELQGEDTITILPHPTSLTNELIKPALKMVESLFVQGKKYKKAGVILSSIVPDDAIQGNLFEGGKSIGRSLMEMMDNINFSMRGNMVNFASAGTKKTWQMQQNFHSPLYTTRWSDLRLVE